MLITNINPHIKRPEIHVGVASKSKPVHIEKCSQGLVWNCNVDMFHGKDIPDILGSSVEFYPGLFLCYSIYHSRDLCVRLSVEYTYPVAWVLHWRPAIGDMVKSGAIR